MISSDQYRKYAYECIQSARIATSDPVRKQFLDLAQLWMKVADRMDLVEAPPQPTNSGQHRTEGSTRVNAA